MNRRTPSAAHAAALLLLLGVGRSGAEMSPSDYGYYDNLRLAPATLLGRAGNVNLHQDGDEVIGLCHLHGLLWIEEDVYSIDSVAAALMALHHFNTGDGAVVDELANINERCAVRFTAEFEDTWGNEYTALSLLADAVGGEQDCGDESGGGNETQTGFISPANLRQSSSTLASSTALPCAILGATRSASTEPTSMLSASYGLPQMSWESGSEELSNKDVYPLFSRVIPAVAATAKASYQHLANLGVQHCAVLYLNDAYGISFLRSFQGFASSGGLNTVSVAYSPNAAAMVNADEVTDAVKNLKATGFRYIYMITYPEHLDLFFEEASRQEVVGGGYHWFVGTDAIYQETVERDSLLDRGYHGVGFLQLTTGKAGQRGYDRFLEEWRELDASAKAHFAKLTPNPAAGYNYTSSVPIGWAFLAYDAVVSLGLAACAATKDNGSFFTGTEMHDGLREVVFEGASGLIRFDEATGTREPTSALFEILNLRRKGITDDGKSEFELVLSTALIPNENGTEWEVLQATPFIFADGTTSPPPDLPPVNGGKGVDYHYVGSLAILGYVLLSVVATLSISFAGWTFVKWNTRVVKASQPPFLLLICAGVFIMSPAIFTLSVDDEHFSTRGASIACQATPWLVSLGFTVSFAALFSKTWRINEVLTNPRRFQRVKVGVRDVLGPFAIFFTMNTIILICWTMLDPLTFVRTVDRDGTDQFNRPISSYGKCTFDGNAKIFMGLLVALNSVVVAFTTVQAYHARKISTDYSESKYIAGCIVCQLEALIIGIPTIAMMSNDANSHRSIFVLASLIIFIVSLALLLLIFVPKILVQSEKRKCSELSAAGGLRFHVNKEAEFRNGVVVVEGGATSNASSGQHNSDQMRASVSRRQEFIEEVKVEED